MCETNTRLIRGTFALVIADTTLLAVLIVMTGGVGSPLDPLLPAISVIAFILRQPHRTIAWSLGVGLAIIFAFTIIHSVHPLTSHWIYDAHVDPRFHGIFGTVLVGAMSLSIVEYWLSYETPRILTGIPESVQAVLDDRQPEVVKARLAKQIRRGAKNWIKWLSWRGLPLKDLSLVHDEKDVIRQAVILCIPYWIDDLTPTPSHFGFIEWAISVLMFVALKILGLDKSVPPSSVIVQKCSARFHRWMAPLYRWRDQRRKDKIARNVTFLTLAAHWVDDHFDALEEHRPEPFIRETILRGSPEQLLDRQLIPRLNEALHGMEKCAHKQNRHHVRNAVIRIIYGGLVQNAPSRERLKGLREEYVNFITRRLVGDQKEIYQKLAKSKRPLAIFLTAKVVMELLDSCSLKADAAKLIREAEFFNLLYCPILYCHDWDDEVAYEQYGKAFGDGDEIRKHLPTVPDLVNIVKSCEPLVPIVFGQSGISNGRLTQLRVLMELYRGHLKLQLTNAYDDFLESVGSADLPIGTSNPENEPPLPQVSKGPFTIESTEAKQVPPIGRHVA